MQNQVIVQTAKMGASGKQELLSVIERDSQILKQDDDYDEVSRIKSDLASQFEFIQEGTVTERILAEHHASVVPDSEDKHSDTT